jgi:L-lactate utilization protein LutC
MRPVSSIDATQGFGTLPDDETMAATVVALEERGFGIDVVEDSEAARAAVLARIPVGASVLTNQSVTLVETGIAKAICGTRLYKARGIAGQVDFAVGTVRAITRDGVLVIASASDSQLASYAWGARQVIFVVGAQKLVPDLESASERVFLKSRVGKILQIHQESPGRIHIALVREAVGS